MVQVFSLAPTESSASLIGKALGTGFSKQAGMAEAERSFQQAQGDPFKLATAMGRLVSQSPEMARAAGPMYEAMMRNMQGKAMGGLKEDQPKEFPYPTTQNQPQTQEAPSITQPGDIQKQIEGFIPPTQEQMMNEAGQLYRENPQMFAGDPNKAVDFVNQKYGQLEKRAKAYQERHKNLTDIQDNVVRRLNEQAKALDAKIPATVMSNMEKEAIDFVKKGHTEEEAMRKYGDQIDEASRQYQEIEDIGEWGLITNKDESIASLNSLQKQFKKRNDLRNFADSIQSKFKVSTPTSYAFADPIKDYPELNKYMKDLPYNAEFIPGGLEENTKNIVPKLSKLISDNKASPQTVFYYMRQKNYDPLVLKDYLDINRDKLELTAYQADQLGKEVSPTIPYLTDLWYSILGGLE